MVRESDQDPTLEQARASARVAQDWVDGKFVDPARYPVVYDGPPIVMKVTGHPPANASAVVRALKPAFRVLEQMSQGRIQVDDHWGASVHSDREGVAALRDGRTHLAPCYSGWDSKAYPLAQALQLPGLFPNSETGTMIAERIYDRFLRADVERQGILMGRMKASGAYHLFSMKPIVSLDDLQGARIGTTEGVEAEVFERLGAIPVALSSLEMNLALSSGRVDAMHLSDGSADVFGISRVARYRTAVGLVRQSLEFGLSAAFWNALPADLKRVLNAWLRAQAQSETQVFYGVAGAEARERAQAAGLQSIALPGDERTRWTQRLAPMIEAFIAREEKAGRPARAMFAAIEGLKAEYRDFTPNDLMRQAIERPVQDINPI